MAAMDRIDLDERSWVDVGRGWVPDADRLYAELAETVAWQPSRVFRYDHWFEEPRLGAWLTPATAPPPLRDLQREMQHRYRAVFEGCSLVWYRDGSDHMAIHRDRDMKWLDDTVVVILTLGVTRPWVMRRKADKFADRLDKGVVHDLSPGAGDVLVLGGATQVGWEHGVPAVPGLTGGRISVQWRWTAKRGRQELGGSYRKPRMYRR